jgi:hypothetical protein
MQLHLQHDFYNIVFKIKQIILATGQAPPPPPPKEKFWMRACHEASFCCNGNALFCDVSAKFLYIVYVSLRFRRANMKCLVVEIISHCISLCNALCYVDALLCNVVQCVVLLWGGGGTRCVTWGVIPDVLIL